MRFVRDELAEVLRFFAGGELAALASLALTFADSSAAVVSA